MLKIIQGLKPKSSAGYDHLSSKVLKDIADIISTPLSIIIYQSLCSGIFPRKLKIAKVILLFEKGDIQSFGNYRPISLLSSVSKVFEKAAYGQLYEYFSSHALFYDSQYGFRKHHSTELAALELVDRIHKEIDENKIPFSVFLDLSKAFDTLDHDILLHKLQYYGITGIALDWFRSYLTERYQYADYNGASSSMKLLTTGVPQGSILGPLLFIIYMNDIHTVSNNLNFILYAYDTTLTSALCSFTTCWGFEWSRLAKLQKRAVRIITNSKYNEHTESLFKNLHLLKITDIFDVQCMKFWYKFSNNTLPNYIRSMFQYNSSLYDIETRNHDRMHVFPTRTFGARNVLRHRLPELVYQFPADLIRKAKTHCIIAFSNHIKHHILESYSYDCIELNCYVCNNIAS